MFLNTLIFHAAFKFYLVIFLPNITHVLLIKSIVCHSKEMHRSILSMDVIILCYEDIMAVKHLNKH